MTFRTEKEITKMVFTDQLHEDLEDFCEELTIDDMVSFTVCHDERDFRELISSKKLKSIRKNGEVYVSKDDFVDWYSDTIPYIPMSEVKEYRLNRREETFSF